MSDCTSKCTRCAKCCRTLTERGKFVLPVSKEDARIIRKNEVFKRLNKEKKISMNKGVYDPLYPYELFAKGLCPFLNYGKNTCKIYDVRPNICRVFYCTRAMHF